MLPEDTRGIRRLGCAAGRYRETHAVLEVRAQGLYRACGRDAEAAGLSQPLTLEMRVADFVGRLVSEWRSLSAKYAAEGGQLSPCQERYHQLVGMTAALDLCADRLEEDLALKAEIDLVTAPRTLP